MRTDFNTLTLKILAFAALYAALFLAFFPIMSWTGVAGLPASTKGRLVRATSVIIKPEREPVTKTSGTRKQVAVGRLAPMFPAA